MLCNISFHVINVKYFYYAMLWPQSLISPLQERRQGLARILRLSLDEIN